jgi:hypothetical protein
MNSKLRYRRDRDTLYTWGECELTQGSVQKLRVAIAQHKRGYRVGAEIRMASRYGSHIYGDYRGGFIWCQIVRSQPRERCYWNRASPNTYGDPTFVPRRSAVPLAYRNGNQLCRARTSCRCGSTFAIQHLS